MKNIIEKIKVNVGNDEKNSVIINLRDGGDCYENPPVNEPAEVEASVSNHSSPPSEPT